MVFKKRKEFILFIFLLIRSTACALVFKVFPPVKNELTQVTTMATNSYSSFPVLFILLLVLKQCAIVGYAFFLLTLLKLPWKWANMESGQWLNIIDTSKVEWEGQPSIKQLITTSAAAVNGQKEKEKVIRY